MPDGTDVDALRAVARDRFGVAMAGALGPLQGKAFRIGHLGDSNAATILGCLGAVQAALQVQGIPVGAGALDRAVASLVASSDRQSATSDKQPGQSPPPTSTMAPVV